MYPWLENCPWNLPYETSAHLNEWVLGQAKWVDLHKCRSNRVGQHLRVTHPITVPDTGRALSHRPLDSLTLFYPKIDFILKQEERIILNRSKSSSN